MEIVRKVKREEAQAMLNFYKLLPIKLHSSGDGFIMTDFINIYHLSKDVASEDADGIWAYNQPFVMYELQITFDEVNFPFWFNKEMFDRAKDCINKVIIGNDGFCYVPEHNLSTGSSWYASNVIEAVRSCIVYLNPIWDVVIKPMTLVYDNGNCGYIDKALQIWKHNRLYHLSSFNSDPHKLTNIENISNEAITLISYATDNRNSKWRNWKMWTKFLKFSGEITEFKQISLRKEYGITYSLTEEIKIAHAGDYILAKMNWGGLFDGEGDSGEELYIFEDESEMLDHINKMHRIE